MTATASHAADPASPAGIIAAIPDEEPVIASAVAAWMLANVGLILAHFHLVGVGQWTGLSQVLASPVAGVLLLAIGWIVRHVVTSPKTMRIVQRELDLARASASSAAAGRQPVVIQLDGKMIAAVAPIDGRVPESATPLDGLPAISATSTDMGTIG